VSAYVPEETLASRLPHWWVPVLVGVLAIIAGILALVWPGPTLLLIGICFGVWLLFAGAGNLVMAFSASGLSTFLRVMEALLGVLSLLAGLILIARPEASVAAIAFVLAFWFLIIGFLQLARGISVPDHRVFNIAFGLLGIAAGIIILAQPGIGVVTIVWVVSITFILNGVLGIALGFSLRSAERHGIGDGPAVAT
jgi:uncharacterized membrane protein HdeD (DUF308 family)